MISSREAADRLGISQATVLRAVARGILKPARTTPGGHHRFQIQDISALAGAPSTDLSTSARLISTGAAAKLLGVSQHTVIRACHEGLLAADETTPGGHIRFSEKRIRELAPLSRDLVGTGSAARALGVTVARLLRAVQRGAVTPAAVTPGGHRRFAASQLSLKGLSASNGNAQGQGRG